MRSTASTELAPVSAGGRSYSTACIEARLDAAANGERPVTISKSIASSQDSIWNADYVTVEKSGEEGLDGVPAHELPGLLESLRSEMKAAAKELDFERAADLRDRIKNKMIRPTTIPTASFPANGSSSSTPTSSPPSSWNHSVSARRA